MPGRLAIVVAAAGLVAIGCREAGVAEPGHTDRSTASSTVSGTSGLVSWWPGEGNANDAQDGNTGTLQNGATFAAGKVGQAFSFDGVDDYVLVANSANLNPSGSFSIDAWIYPRSYGFEHIVAKWDPGRSYSFHTLGTGALRFAISDDAHQSDAGFHDFDTPNGVLTLNAWNYVAAVYDQATGTRRIFVNGAEVATRTDPPITVSNTAASVGIGAHAYAPGGFDLVFDGLIDEARLYNRALSAQEITDNYNNPGATPPYQFTGFFQPVDNPGAGESVVNVAKAGSGIPVKFSLGGDQGLAIFKDGYPRFVSTPCDATDTPDQIETTTPAPAGLTYDPTTQQYTYVWRTLKAWADRCGTFELGLKDGSDHHALFRFTR